MFINRTWSRLEEDDFKLNVQPRLSDLVDAIPIYHDGKVIGWRLQNRYE